MAGEPFTRWFFSAPFSTRREGLPDHRETDLLGLRVVRSRRRPDASMVSDADGDPVSFRTPSDGGGGRARRSASEPRRVGRTGPRAVLAASRQPATRASNGIRRGDREDPPGSGPRPRRVLRRCRALRSQRRLEVPEVPGNPSGGRRRKGCAGTPRFSRCWRSRWPGSAPGVLSSPPRALRAVKAWQRSGIVVTSRGADGSST